MENSPYQSLVDKGQDRFPILHPCGRSPAKEARTKGRPIKFTAIILPAATVWTTFRVAEEMRYKIPDSLKYFCQSDVAFTCRSTWYIERENLCRETNLPELIPWIKSIRMKLSSS
jgi:hypothetical protein